LFPGLQSSATSQTTTEINTSTMESDSEWAGFDTDTNVETNASSTDDSEEEWSGISNTAADDDAAAARSDPPIAMTLASPQAAQYESYEELLASINVFAKDQGFAIVSQRTLKTKRGKGDFHKAYLICDRGATYRSTAIKRFTIHRTIRSN